MKHYELTDNLSEKQCNWIVKYIDMHTIELGYTNYPYVSACDLKEILIANTEKQPGQCLYCIGLTMGSCPYCGRIMQPEKQFFAAEEAQAEICSECGKSKKVEIQTPKYD